MKRAFVGAGLELPDDLIRPNAGDAESIRKITHGLLQRPDPATAIIASDGLIGLSVVEAIQVFDLSIPQDVSFLMNDDFAWTRLTTPPLTVIAQPVYLALPAARPGTPDASAADLGLEITALRPWTREQANRILDQAAG